jgi:inhibitor of KinA
MKWIQYGPSALLFQFADRLGDQTFAKGQAITAELERRPPSGLVEFVPALTTVLLEFDPRLVPNLRELAEQICQQLESAAAVEPLPSPAKEIPVIYDGPDLERVARHHGLAPNQVGQLHAAPIYKVYMLGFTPGFPYLGDLDPRLHTPRLSSPRSTVRAGSIAIGGAHTGIYSVDSPGGWNIIGHTTVKLFDLSRATAPDEDQAMFFLQAGDRVKFVPAVL